MDCLIDPNASKEVAMTSLDWCARSGQLSLLKAVLSAHFSHCAISDLERECSLLLRNAVTAGCTDTLTSLLRHVDDAFLQQRDDREGSDDVREGRTRLEKLLGLSVECGHRDITEVLLKKGANPNAAYRGKPLLHLSLSLGHQQVASLLLDHGADVNMTDSKGETPLFTAVSSDKKEMSKIINKLMEKGSDINHRSLTGRQPIHSAALVSDSNTLTQLAQAGCDVSTKDDVMGDTPLHLACSRCNQAAVMTLIQLGADFNKVNDQGHTPLRKLLQHTTRVSRDFHHHSRMKLARVLVMLGFQLDPSTSEVARCENVSFDQNTDKTLGRSLYTQSSTNNRSFPSKPSRSSKQTSKHTEDLNMILKNPSHVETSSKTTPARSCRKSWGTRGCGRDKVWEVFQSVGSERKGVACLQHLCRLQVRQQMPKVLFQENVRKLEVSAGLHQYLMFLPGMLDHTLGC